MKYNLGSTDSQIPELKEGCFKKKDHDENIKILNSNSSQKTKQNSYSETILTEYEKYLEKCRRRRKSSKMGSEASNQSQFKKNPAPPAQISIQTLNQTNIIQNNFFIFSKFNPNKKNLNKIVSSSMYNKQPANVELIRNPRHPPKPHKINFFLSYGPHGPPDNQDKTLKSFEEHKFLSETANKTCSELSYQLEDNIKKLSRDEIIQNYQQSLKQRSNSLNLQTDPSVKIDTILVNFKDFHFVVKNYQTKEHRPLMTLQDLCEDIIRGICQEYHLESEEKIKNYCFRGLNEAAYVKDIGNILMYIGKRQPPNREPQTVLVRIINADGKLKNFLPFDSVFIKVRREGTVHDILTAFENMLNISMVHFRLFEYFPFEEKEGAAGQESFCSISIRNMTMANSNLSHSTTMKSRAHDQTQEATYEPAERKQFEITFKDVVDLKMRSPEQIGSARPEGIDLKR